MNKDIKISSSHPASSKKSEIFREAALFGIVGMVNTAVGYGTILLLMAANIGPIIANMGGYAVGLCCSYYLNSRVTFSKRKNFRSRIFRFLAVFLICWFLNLGILALMLTYLPAALAQLVAMAVYTVSFFFLSRAFVFVER